jgi:aspartate aminotransferase-like enzyme
VPERTYLITPGPTPVPPEVAAAMARPLIHHRSPDFKLLLEQTLAQLRRAFATEQEVLLFAGSGTSAMESAVANLLSPGDDILVASAGNFGDRWTKIARAYGIEPRIHAQPWGEVLDPETVAAQAQGAVAVYITHSETSTGVVHDVRAIVEALRTAGALLVVDAVSSLGGVELAMDEWGIDVVVSGSQKALMTPPGLAFAAASERAWAISEQAALPRFTLDWRVTRDSQEKVQTPYTPPITLVAGLNTALGMIEAEGFESVWARNRLLGRASREGAKALGLELFSPDDDSSSMVTAVQMPDGVDGQEVYRLLRDRFGVVLAGGHGPLRGKVIRIGHMGYMNRFDIITALSALELVLGDLGYRAPTAGAGAARAVEVFAQLETSRV